MKGQVSRKVVRCYFNRNTKEQVSKKVASYFNGSTKEQISEKVVRCLFQWKYERTGSRKSGMGVVFNGSMMGQVSESDLKRW